VNPIEGSLQTQQLGEDGWQMGNDLQTVTDVWQLNHDVLEWLRSHPDKIKKWWSISPDKHARGVQERLRARRRLLWTAISECANARGAEAYVIVGSLQGIQTTTGVGISRVEAWATDAKKCPDKDILTLAEEYLTLTNHRIAVTQHRYRGWRSGDNVAAVV
jgi:hypothetical protein